MGEPRCVPRQHFQERKNLAAFRGNISRGVKTLLRSAADFQRQYGRRHRFQFAHIRAYAIRPYNWRRKTNTKRHDASPYPQRTKGKYVGAYRIRPPHERIWPTKELFIMKLTGKTLLGFRGTFPQAGKPCSVPGEHFPGREIPRCVLRQAFNDSMLVAVISCSPTSGRMRYAPTLSGEILTQNCTIHYRALNEQMVNM